MDRLSVLMGKEKPKKRPPTIDIESSDEASNSYDDDIQLLPLRATRCTRGRPTSPTGSGCSIQPTYLPESRCASMLHGAEQSTSKKKPQSDFMNTCSLPKIFKRSDRRSRRLNTELLEAIKNCNRFEVERILNLGANPNATCHLGCVSACHLAAFTGGETLRLLIDRGADPKRFDRSGRTPLHLAAWSGNLAEIAILLDFPQGMNDKDKCQVALSTSAQLVATLTAIPLFTAKRVLFVALQLKLKHRVQSEMQGDINKCCMKKRDQINLHCKTDEVNMMLPKDWLDNIDHHCRDLQKSLPLIQPGWTALHAASANAKYECARLLLTAGAEPHVRDYVGRTPLDVVGCAYYEGHNIDKRDFTEAVNLLLESDIRNSTIIERKPFDTALHTAVEVESLEAITELVGNGALVTCHNRNGLTPLHVCVNKKLKEHLRILANSGFNKLGSVTSVVDSRNKNGHTVLHAAVLARWAPGVCVCLEAGATVTAKDVDGETPIHLAAALGDLDILNEILGVVKQSENINFRNSKGETALFKAIMHGHLECVQKLLKEGASIKITLPMQVNVFHVAAELGAYDILKILLNHDYTITRSSINFTTADDKKGFGPIHFATWNNHSDCVKLLLSMNAFVSLRTTYGLHKQSTPLHLAAVQNNVEIAKILYRSSKETITNVDIMGWTPLHTASHHKSRDVVFFLLQQGADLAAYTNGPNKMLKTSIEMIMDSLSKPTEFMEDVFDSCIINNNVNLQDSNYDTKVDYQILLPKGEDTNQMKVLQALVKTGNRRNQRRLLLHPLIESFLFFKWKGLVPYFYASLLLNGIFVIALSLFIISIFYYKDKSKVLPYWLNGYVWIIIVYISALLLIIQEVLHIAVGKSYYYLQIETWIKFSSIFMAIVLPFLVAKTSPKVNWPRHVASAVLLLSWFQMMFMLSRFPNWGYYVLMFKKVSLNVLKILLTFAFLLIGFSLSFMIEFHSNPPFENPFAAFVKTMVMMTSEFDFDDLINKKNLGNVTTSLLFARLMFLGFLILTAIVLMNLMVGVAVNDLHNLQVQGNIQRLKMQVEFLTSLENLVHNGIFKRLLPNMINHILVPKMKSLTPNDTERPTYLPERIKESAFNIGLNRKKEALISLVNVNNKCNQLDETNKLPSQFETRVKANVNKKEMTPDLEHLSLTVEKLENKFNIYTDETRNSIEMINTKMESILNRLDDLIK